VLGKVVGGGMPAAAFGGRGDLMEQLAPLGAVYQAGTLSGNPLAMAAGLATLELLDDAAYATLEARGARLQRELALAASTAGFAARVQRAGSLLTLFFTDRIVLNEEDAQSSDRGRFARFHAAMLRRGVMLPPSQFECWFLSLAHDDDAIATIADAATASLKEIG
jgi:glutamate-1-semialdehyde 2,1-aminomutase